MLQIQKQTAILEKISQIMHEEAERDYEKASCDFESFGEGDEETAITTFSYTANGQAINTGLSDKNIFEAVDSAVKLRTLMKAHTGGEWTSFTLTLDADGQAKTKFVYPES